MEIVPITVGTLETNCYILYDENKNGIIIDPGADCEIILNEIENRDLNIDKIVLTHGHFDHIGAVSEVQKSTGAKITIHSEDEEMVKEGRKNLSSVMGADYEIEKVDRLLQEGDTIKVGSYELNVIHTPGHTKGGICLRLEDRAIFTGDTLFMHSIGRTDFYGGNYRALIESIKEKIMPLDDKIIIYPGHGPSSSIGSERINNPYLQKS